jgi:hypothetical protein
MVILFSAKIPASWCGQAFADAVIAWLRERGFSLRGVYNMAYDNGGRAVQADFLFGRRGLAVVSTLSPSPSPASGRGGMPMR